MKKIETGTPGFTVNQEGNLLELDPAAQKQFSDAFENYPKPENRRAEAVKAAQKPPRAR